MRPNCGPWVEMLSRAMEVVLRSGPTDSEHRLEFRSGGERRSGKSASLTVRCQR